MKRAWLVWGVVGAVVVTVLIAFNYERGKEVVPLTEVFPEKNAMNNTVEYEFFDSDEKASAPTKTANVSTGSPLSAPAVLVSLKKGPAAAVPQPPVTTRAGASTASVAVKTPQVASAPVNVPASRTSIAPTTSASVGKVYTIQVGAFKDQSGANKAVEQARQKGYTAFVDQRSKSDGSVWYQVCIGRFDGQQAAKELLTKIKQDYKDGYIKILTNH